MSISEKIGGAFLIGAAVAVFGCAVTGLGMLSYDLAERNYREKFYANVEKAALEEGFAANCYSPKIYADGTVRGSIWNEDTNTMWDYIYHSEDYDYGKIKNNKDIKNISEKYKPEFINRHPEQQEETNEQ